MLHVKHLQILQEHDGQTPYIYLCDHCKQYDHIDKSISGPLAF